MNSKIFAVEMLLVVSLICADAFIFRIRQRGRIAQPMKRIFHTPQFPLSIARIDPLMWRKYALGKWGQNPPFGTEEYRSQTIAKPIQSIRFEAEPPFEMVTKDPLVDRNYAYDGKMVTNLKSMEIPDIAAETVTVDPLMGRKYAYLGKRGSAGPLKGYYFEL